MSTFFLPHYLRGLGKTFVKKIFFFFFLTQNMANTGLRRFECGWGLVMAGVELL